MRNKQKGFSLIELLIVVAIILIIAAIAIPNLLRSRMAANEASAVGTLRSLNTAAVTYSTSCGGFPMTKAAMGPPLAGCATADLIDAVLAGPGAKSGYTFVYTPGAANAAGFADTYTILADPTTLGTTGNRSFFTDQSGVIRAKVGATGATVGDPPIG